MSTELRKSPEERIKDLQLVVDKAYMERDALVVLLSKIYESHLCKHDDLDLAWDNEWMNIVCIHTPMGQATWHIHISEIEDFDHLELKPNHWDGHKTSEKYKRIASIKKSW